MAKKRVHELAKELNLESKDLIARLEKMGISVKSHSSTLEDDDVEKIRESLLSGDSRQIVEERIKSTVIRRRTVRAPAEEQPTQKEETAAEEAVAAPTEKEVKEKKGAPEKAAAAPSLAETAEAKKKLSKKEDAKTPAGPEAADAEKVKQPTAATPKPIVFVKHKITKPEIKKAPKPEKPQKPGEKIIVPPPEKSVKKEFDKTKRKGKAPVEVFIEEEKAVPRRKVLEKKTDKKLRKQDDDREVSFIKWRDEKKAAPVKMKKTEITVPKAIKRRIKIGDTISVGELAKRMGVKASEVINKLIGMGVMATINQSIDYDIASLVTSEFSFQVEKAELDFDESTLKVAASPENLKPSFSVNHVGLSYRV